MLQQNNNNNYPCLNMSGSAPDVLQKCSKASLPFPSRLELGLGDLPLIRGLRAWTLCSKNRLKAGSLLKGGQAPTAPPAGHRGSTSCPRPADVYLSGEWGHMAYGLPVEPEGKAGIRALVTVATLKTSEGSGKTQTHCLFLQTEKGSCLYSTAKPVSVATSSTTSSLVGEWLKGKTGGRGSRDAPARRREHGSTSAAQSGANRVRVRSGRRWRKSSNPAGREKTGVSRDRQQSSGKDPAGEITLDERQEERNKDSSDRKQSPSPEQDIRRARQEKEGPFRGLRCCHNASPKACTQCGGRAQRRGSQGGESPRGGIPNRLSCEVKGMKKERQRNEEEEDEAGLCNSPDSVSALLNSNLESNHHHPESLDNSDIGENREAESSEEMNSHSQSKDDYSEKDEDAESELMKTQTGFDSTHEPSEQDRDDFTLRRSRGFDDQEQRENPSEETFTHLNGLIDAVEAQMEEEVEHVDVKEEKGSGKQFTLESGCCGDVCICPASICAEPSTPDEGSTCDASSKTCFVPRDQESSTGCQQGRAESGIMGKEELDISTFEQHEWNCAAETNTVIEDGEPLFFFQCVLEDGDASLRPRDPSVLEQESRTVTENGCNFSTNELVEAVQRDELTWENRGEESREKIMELRVNPEEGDDAGEIRGSGRTCKELDDCDGKVDYDKERQTKDDDKTIIENCALKDKWRLEEPSAECGGRRKEGGDTCGQTSICQAGAERETSTRGTSTASAAPCTSPALPLANPAPSTPLLGSMTTSLPCLEAEKEEEEEEERVSVGERDQEVERRKEGELEEQHEEERGSTVATEEGSREEEKEEEEDEFGVFMQAEGELAWSEGSTMPASVPCGCRESVGECRSSWLAVLCFVYIS